MKNFEELNKIQSEWMNLQADAPEKEKQRVLKLMSELPNIYVSGYNGKGITIVNGQPIQAGVSFEKAMAACKDLGGRTDIAWNGNLGKWYEVKEVKVCKTCEGLHPVGCCPQDGRD